MKTLLAMLLIAVTASAETILIYDAGNGYDIACSHGEFMALNLPHDANAHPSPDLEYWRSLGLRDRPIPAALVDSVTGISVPVTLATVDAATNALAALVATWENNQTANTDDGGVTWGELKGTNALLRAATGARKDAYDADRTTATNKIATSNIANTNQLRNVLDAVQNEIESMQKEIAAMRDEEKHGWKVDQFLRKMDK